MNALVCSKPKALQSYFRTPALPPGQIREFLTMAQSVTPNIISLEGEWHFYVDATEVLSQDELGRLTWLLAETFQPELFSSQPFLAVRGDSDFLVEIGPRKGTVTDWSSNMETICQACGLGKVERVERFRRLRFRVNPRGFADSHRRLIVPNLFDRMTEQVYTSVLTTFDPGVVPAPVQTIPLLRDGVEALRKFASAHNLKFLPEIESYIMNHFVNELKRDPTNVELFDFGQLNSPHCRHHEFNGEWEINGVTQERSLMDWIKGTVKTCGMGNLVVAFTDNAAITAARPVWALVPQDPRGPSPFILVEVERGDSEKIETHNHPTGIDPEKGAATGVAVDRDNMGSGQGGVPEDHTACYYVAHLMIKDYPLPWEQEYVQHPRRFATPRVILTKASDGASANANCRGIPVIYGSTTSFELVLNEGEPDEEHFGYKKPVMVAGCSGWVDKRHFKKNAPQAGWLLVQSGGKSRAIGVGGGSGSSHDAGAGDEELDWNSVQRDEPAMERSNIDLIAGCVALGDDNPIETLTDLGAGGDGVAGPELVFPSGAKFYLRRLPCGDKTMTVLVYFNNEGQERMLYLIRREKYPVFKAIAERYRCPVYVVGEVTGDGQFTLIDEEAPADAPREQQFPIDLAMSFMLADLPPVKIKCEEVKRRLHPPVVPKVSVREHLDRVFRWIRVGSVEFITNKGDRTVRNRSALQPTVGGPQLPLADLSVRADGPWNITGMTKALGEQPIVMLVDVERGVEMSIAEALLQSSFSQLKDLREISMSATWQWPMGQPGENARLYRGVKASSLFTQRVRSRKGVGKDSVSMTMMAKNADGSPHPIKSPGTVQYQTFATCTDITKTLTPDLKAPGKSHLMFIDLGENQQLGGSALLYVYKQLGHKPPRIKARVLVSAMEAMQKLIASDLALSAHDRSDGGLITCLCEMAFAGNCGLNINLNRSRLHAKSRDRLLFNQNCGVVIEYRPKDLGQIRGIMRRCGLAKRCHVIGQTTDGEQIRVKYDGQVVLDELMPDLRAIWRETSFQMEYFQTNRECVDAERVNTYRRKPIKYVVPFRMRPTAFNLLVRNHKPGAAVCSEVATNGDRDLAESLYLAGFEPTEVRMTDLELPEFTLDPFWLLALPGGFTFGDTGDAAKGWAGEILFNSVIAQKVLKFRRLKFGVCNGCQAMPLLGMVPWEGIPMEKRPRLLLNQSERFEHRWVKVGFQPSDSVFLKGFEGAALGAPTGHEQGRWFFPDQQVFQRVKAKGLAPIRYLDDDDQVTEKYPFNPNGSPEGIGAVISEDGLSLATMVHFEREPMVWNWLYAPGWDKKKVSPALRMFQNAREYCDQC